ncbi:DUF6968 family protein [Burkholderia metallica]|uniref:DUF6968 family protein n=1 Tax=Burkholderia metallica TaxID=488729 RepID=UPI003851587B
MLACRFKMAGRRFDPIDSGIFVERVYDLDSEYTVRIRIYRPEMVSVRDWRCTLEIMWPDRTVHREIWGIDGLQSLLLAMQAARAEFFSAE